YSQNRPPLYFQGETFLAKRCTGVARSGSVHRPTDIAFARIRLARHTPTAPRSAVSSQPIWRRPPHHSMTHGPPDGPHVLSRLSPAPLARATMRPEPCTTREPRPPYLPPVPQIDLPAPAPKIRMTSHKSPIRSDTSLPLQIQQNPDLSRDTHRSETARV